eukprot:159732-Pleurochrysis_carterae.AAC.1
MVEQVRSPRRPPAVACTRTHGDVGTLARSATRTRVTHALLYGTPTLRWQKVRNMSSCVLTN